MTLVPAVLGVLSQSIALATSHLVSVDLRDPVHAVATLLERFVLQPFVAIFVVPAGVLVYTVIFFLALFVLMLCALPDFAFRHLADLLFTTHVVAATYAAVGI